MRLWPLLLVVAACSKAPSATPDPAAAAAASAAPAPVIPKGVLTLGAPVEGAVVSLADIAKNPGAFASKTVTTTGKVTAVCQARGCWMELQDAAGEAHVKMHGHEFFVPKTAAGHMAKVQATVLTGDVEHCEESPAPTSGGGKALAKVELDATGVELD